MTDEQWAQLLEAAASAMRQAYCPYSHFPVGTAGLTTEGRLVSGCNVENAAYGVTLCAECGMISELIKGGGGRLRGVVAVDAAGTPIAPCGRCRQLIFEHGGPQCLVLMPSGAYPMSYFLPDAFGPDNLHAHAHAEADASTKEKKNYP